MGGFHDILWKVISSIRRFVDHNIWSMRRLGDYDVWFTTTYRLKFVELCRNSSEFSRKRTRNNCCFLLLFFFLLLLLPPTYKHFRGRYRLSSGSLFTCQLGLSLEQDAVVFFSNEPLVGLEVGLHTILIRGAMLCT